MSKRIINQFNALLLFVLTLGIVLSVSSVSFSADTYTIPQTAAVTLAWDPNGPTPDGYHIYQRIEGQSYDYTQPCWTGPDTSGTVYNLDWDTTYYFVVRGYTQTQESADSQEVSYFAPSPEPTAYSITASAGANGTITPPGVSSVDQGGSQPYTITPDAGYHVSDVIVDGVSIGAVSSYTFSPVTADHTIDVSFAIDSYTTYTITASAVANGTITPPGVSSVDQGGSQPYTITPDAGYHVSDVKVDGVSIGAVSSYTFSQITANHTISASFDIDSYTIIASAGANGTITPAGVVNLSYGGSQAYTMDPNDGYHIAQVLVDGVGVGTSTTHVFSDVSTNHTISVNFGVDVYTLTAAAGEGGSIFPSGQITVNSGASQTYTLTTDTGYEIQDLLINGQSQGVNSSFTLQDISTNYTVEARFALMNQAPTADAGPDQEVDEAQEVVLSGLNSIDLDDGIATFKWRQIQGAEVVLSSLDQAVTTFTAPDVGPSGTSLVFELAVTDYSHVTTVDTCIVNVTWVNLPPTADAGGEQKVSEGTKVVLDGVNSVDLDDGIVDYRWKQLQGPVVALSVDQSSAVSFNAPDTGPDGASMTFQLTVSDAGGLQDTDTCLVTVGWVNTPPLADAGSDQDVNIGDEVVLDGSMSTDTDDHIIAAYRWRQTDGVPVELSDATAEKPTFEAPEVGIKGDTLTFELTVTDSGGMLGMDTVSVVITVDDLDDTLNAPSGLIASTTGNTVTLAWNHSGANEDGFYIERALKVRGRYRFTRVASVGANATGYVDIVARRGIYKYRVQTYSQSLGVSGYSAQVSVSVSDVVTPEPEPIPDPEPTPDPQPIPDPTPDPVIDTFAAPSSLRVSTSGRTAVLTWTDNTSDESGFIIERATRSRRSIIYNTIGQVTSGHTAFNDACGAGTFYYRVRAFKTGALSGYSNAVRVRVR